MGPNCPFSVLYYCLDERKSNTKTASFHYHTDNFSYELKACKKASPFYHDNDTAEDGSLGVSWLDTTSQVCTIDVQKPISSSMKLRGQITPHFRRPWKRNCQVLTGTVVYWRLRLQPRILLLHKSSCQFMAAGESNKPQKFVPRQGNPFSPLFNHQRDHKTRFSSKRNLH